MSDDAHQWPEPPDPELLALLASAGTPPPAPSGARERVFERVALTVAAPLGGPGEPLGGTSSAGGATGSTGAAHTVGAGSSVSAATTSAAAGASVSVATGASGWGAALLGVLAIGLAGGLWLALAAPDPAPPQITRETPTTPDAPAPPPIAPQRQPMPEPGAAAAGAAAADPPARAPLAIEPPAVEAPPASVHRRAIAPVPPRPRPARSGQTRAPSTEQATPASEVTRNAPARPTAAAPAPAAPTPAAPTGHADLALSAERRLLLAAVRGIEDGDLHAARIALDRYTERFPTGRLADERTVLHIRWLLAARRPDAARSAADAFREEAPDSLMRPAVDRLVAPRPGP